MDQTSQVMESLEQINGVIERLHQSHQPLTGLKARSVNGLNYEMAAEVQTLLNRLKQFTLDCESFRARYSRELVHLDLYGPPNPINFNEINSGSHENSGSDGGSVQP